MKFTVKVFEHSGLLLSMEPIYTTGTGWCGGKMSARVEMYSVTFLDKNGCKTVMTTTPDNITITKE